MLREGNCISGTLWGHEVEGLAYRPAARGPWDENPLLSSPDIGQREQPGLRRYLRRQKNGQAYDGRDPEKLCAFKVPEQFQTMLRNVFGAERCKKLKLAMHPHMKRICLFEKHTDPSHGRLEEWRLIWVCQTQPQEGVCPSDYRGDREREHLTGLIGEFKWPEVEELEFIEKTDKKKYGADNVELFWAYMEKSEEDERERVMQDRTEGFLDYYFNLARDEANQAYGSGQRMSSYATIKLRGNRRKWRHVQKEGYTLIERISPEEAKAIEMDIAAFDAELKQRKEDRENWRRYRTPEERKAIERERKRIAYEVAREKELVKEGRSYRPMTSRELARFFRAGMKGEIK